MIILLLQFITSIVTSFMLFFFGKEKRIMYAFHIGKFMKCDYCDVHAPYVTTEKTFVCLLHASRLRNRNLEPYTYEQNTKLVPKDLIQFARSRSNS